MSTRRRPWAVIAAVSFALTACGGSQTDAELQAALGGAASGGRVADASTAPSPGITPDTEAGPPSPAPGPDVAAPSPTGPGSTPVPGPAPAGSSPTPKAAPRDGVQPGTPGVGAGSSGAPRPGASASPAPPKPAPAPPTAPPPAGEAAAGPKPPIKLGLIGTRTGAVGALFIPFYEGARAWLGDINARGGLNGHPVEFSIADDGGDPRRALAAARHMVEQEKVSAFFGEHTPFSLGAILPYLEKMNVPVVGGAALDPGGDESPMIFYLKPGPKRGLAWSFISGLAYSDAKDLGLIYCREAPVCQAAFEGVKQLAGEMNKKVKFEAQMSVAQPDYTAEVLAARSAGAQAIVIIADNNTAARVAFAAHRQDWYPDMATAGAILAEKNLKENGADLVGMYTGAYGPHWTSPLLADYVAATRKYVPDGLGLAAHSINIWVAGKLLERIAPQLPAGPVVPTDVLGALAGVKDETLGGLIPPMTFAPGSARNHHQCSIPMRIAEDLSAEPLGDGQFVCAPGYQPGA